MAAIEEIQELQTELIRKALSGSLFISQASAAGIVDLTQATGTAPNQVIDFVDLPEGWGDLGYMPDDGISHATETSQSEITSWQSITPTRSDITARTTTITAVGQETKGMTLGLYTGADFAAIKAKADTGEVSIAIPERPSARFYRLLSLAVDEGDGGPIYIARYFPRAKVTGLSEQAFGKGDNAIGWGFTFQGYKDSTVGYSERLMFGGPGWKALLTKMGIASLP